MNFLKHFRDILFFCVINVFAASLDTKEEAKGEVKLEKVNTGIYVINLDYSIDRLKSFDKQMKKFGLEYKRFDAVDGYGLKIMQYNREYGAKNFPRGLILMPPLQAKVVSNLYKDAAFSVAMPVERLEFRKKIGLHISFGELGAAYSHRAIWFDILKNNSNRAIIFEDDVLLLGDFKKNLLKVLKNIPKDADIVMLGWNALYDYRGGGIEIMRIAHVNNVLGIYQGRKGAWGLYAYIVTKKGAKKLIKATQNFSVPIDVAMEDLIKSKKLTSYFPYKKLVTAKIKNSIITAMGRMPLIVTSAIMNRN